MLLVDAGNTRCKWVISSGGKWQQQGVIENADAAAWRLLREQFADLPVPQRILVSNVAGDSIAERLRLACAVWEVMPEFVMSQKLQCGVRNLYEQPALLGSDRWCALIAAWQRKQEACLVVNCGTATTIDALTSAGEFAGGLILPGLALMQRSLTENTAQLDVTKGCLQTFPRNTADAIYSGAVRATAGAVQRQLEKLQKDVGKACPVLLSGGAAVMLAEELQGTVELIDDLVLQGLWLMAQSWI